MQEKASFHFIPYQFVLLEAVYERSTLNVNMYKFINILIKILKHPPKKNYARPVNIENLGKYRQKGLLLFHNYCYTLVQVILVCFLTYKLHEIQLTPNKTSSMCVCLCV